MQTFLSTPVKSYKGIYNIIMAYYLILARVLKGWDIVLNCGAVIYAW